MAHIVPIRIPYRETIRRVASAQGRHKKQTGGAGQFGDCYLRVEPLLDGTEYEFVDEVVGGRIPRALIPAVDKGVQETMKEGVIAGYPLTGIRVACYDGSYHPVDSNEMAFRAAARIGLKKACADADPVVLEPMENITVTIPESLCRRGDGRCLRLAWARDRQWTPTTAGTPSSPRPFRSLSSRITRLACARSRAARRLHHGARRL